MFDIDGNISSFLISYRIHVTLSVIIDDDHFNRRRICKHERAVIRRGFCCRLGTVCRVVDGSALIRVLKSDSSRIRIDRSRRRQQQGQSGRPYVAGPSTIESNVTHSDGLQCGDSSRRDRSSVPQDSVFCRRFRSVGRVIDSRADIGNVVVGLQRYLGCVAGQCEIGRAVAGVDFNIRSVNRIEAVNSGGNVARSSTGMKSNRFVGSLSCENNTIGKNACVQLGRCRRF